jgi:hypothetical protein
MAPALFDPARHEPLVFEAWNESEVRICIDEIVAAAVHAHSPEHFFHPHPQDESLTDESGGTSLYMGAVGVFWGIAHLSAAGVVVDQRDWVRAKLDAMMAGTADLGIAEGSLLLGPCPAFVLRASLAPPGSAAADFDTVHARLTRAASGPVQEMLWGIPGGALLAEFLLRRTGDVRWRTLLARQLDAIWQARIELPGVGLMWQEELYGQRTLYLGAVHGFAGQVLPLLRAFTLLSDEQRRLLRGGVTQTLQRTALRGEQGVNWPDVAAGSKCLLQFCHGAPGIVTCLADVRTDVLPDIDDLMLGAGELIWNEGPLAKGSNLCHGTAGNGVAFLKLFARTGDQRWLERARAFAMHGIRQYRQAKRRFGQDRYSLWTGDIGFAVFLRDCLDEIAAFPTVDVF